MESGIRAIDIMTKTTVATTPNMSIAEASKLMNDFRVGGLPVIDNKGQLLGIVTERDIMHNVVALDKVPSKVLVKDIMSKPPKVIGTENEDMNSLARKMAQFDVARIPIIKNNELVGMVTNKDILKHAPELLDIVLEKAKVKGRYVEDPISFGSCELCGASTNLIFKENKFLCSTCLR
jgi:CBS domain-containing protein